MPNELPEGCPACGALPRDWAGGADPHKFCATPTDLCGGEVVAADKAAAARYLAGAAFGVSVKDYLAAWAEAEKSEDGYCHPLWIVLRDHRIAALYAKPQQPAAEAWRHKKRGTVYEKIGVAELQVANARYTPGEGDIMVIYRGEDGKLWAREADEFHDGRFEAVPAALSSRSATPEVGGEELVERVARAIWAIQREDLDKCDMDLEDVGDHYDTKKIARAALAAMPTPAAIRAETTAQVVAWLNNRAMEQISDDSGVPNDDHAAARYNALHFAALDLARGDHLKEPSA